MPDATCNVTKCPLPVLCRGWCNGHYIRWKKTGDPGTSPIERRQRRQPAALKPGAKPCTVPECGDPPIARGWCGKHYAAWRAHGDPLVNNARVAGTCCAPTCVRTARIKGLCETHHDRLQRTGDIRADIPIVVGGWRPPKGRCTAPDCRKPVKARELCRKHYGELRLTEIKSDPEKLAAYKLYHQQWHANWRTQNQDRARELFREWAARNPEAVRMRGAAKRVKRQSAPSLPFTVEQLADRMRYWGNRCWMCGGPFEAIDHVKPLSKGGWHALMNLRPACSPCNGSKGARWPWPGATAA